MQKLFLSGAIVGNSKAVITTINFFTKLLKLPYPVKMFGHFDDAHQWTMKIQKK